MSRNATVGGKVEGRVVDDETGAPLAGALVDVGDPVERLSRVRLATADGAVRTDAEGRFQLTGVDGRPLWLFASHHGYPVQTVPLSSRTNAELRLQRGVTIVGKVHFPELRDGTIIAMSVHGIESVSIERDGAFRLEGLRSGSWTLGVNLPGDDGPSFEPETVTATAPEIVSVEFAPQTDVGALSVEGNVDDVHASLLPTPGPTPTTHAELRAALRGAISGGPRDDGFRFASVPAGSYTLLVIGSAGAPKLWRVQTQTVQISEGGEHRVRVEWGPGAVLMSFDRL